MPDYRTVLFDLDGTLADTAPDLATSLNILRREEGLEELPYGQIRAHVSNGSSALIRIGFDSDEREPDFERRRLRLLDIYRQHLCVETRLFPGMAAVLDELDRRRCRCRPPARPRFRQRPGCSPRPYVSWRCAAG